ERVGEEIGVAMIRVGETVVVTDTAGSAEVVPRTDPLRLAVGGPLAGMTAAGHLHGLVASPGAEVTWVDVAVHGPAATAGVVLRSRDGGDRHHQQGSQQGTSSHQHSWVRVHLPQGAACVPPVQRPVATMQPLVNQQLGWLALTPPGAAGVEPCSGGTAVWRWGYACSSV